MDITSNKQFSSILLIEDEPAHAELIKRTLKKSGSAIEVASNGAAGLARLETGGVDLVFCDLRLPDMDGCQVICELNQRYPALPVVVMTSSTRIEDAVSAINSGAWDYVVKSFDEALYDRMLIVLERVKRRHEQQIRESKAIREREAMAKAAQSATEGLAIVYADGSIAYANPAFQVFFQDLCENADGHCPSTIEGTNLVDALKLAHPDIGEAFEKRLGAGDGDAILSKELTISRSVESSKGSQQFYQLTLVGYGDGQEITQRQPLHKAALWVHDITSQKRKEKLQRELLSTTTHDLKGPLSAILTASEIMTSDDSQLSELSGKLITRVASCARNCITLIDELLSLSRIEEGLLILKPSKFDLAELLEEIHGDFKLVAMARGVELMLDPALKSAPIVVVADRVALARVINNLVSNAIKFTREGGWVRMSATLEALVAKISIADNGSGIGGNARHNLFKRYSRLDAHSKEEGTGLGLYIVKNIVSAHSGSVELESAVGIGSTFTVCLPVSGPTPFEESE